MNTMNTTPAMPDLTAVIKWLENGCDPREAVKELKHYQSKLQALATLQAQPAEVSDDEISRLWSWSATAEAERTATTQQHAFARAILALRPRAVPMTDAWQEVAACPDGDVWFSLSCGHVVMGWKQGPLLLDWEGAIDHDCCSDASAIKAMPVTPPAHHGITAPAGGEKQA